MDSGTITGLPREDQAVSWGASGAKRERHWETKRSVLHLKTDRELVDANKSILGVPLRALEFGRRRIVGFSVDGGWLRIFAATLEMAHGTVI